jgi:putative Mg2+ transporter-C (MgtC) family protein
VVISNAEMLIRMGVAASLGGAIGYERQRSGRPAGLRTHLIVSLASATFMLVSTQFIYFQKYGKDDLVEVDTSRIAASVVSGVGFLGAGVVLRNGLGVQGITTAASLWLSAALGLASGGGMYEVAVASTAVALFALVVLRRLTKGKEIHQFPRRLVVMLKDDGTARQSLLGRLASSGVTVADEDYDLNVRRGRSRLVLDVRLLATSELDKLVALLSAMQEVRRVKVQRPSG